MNHQREEIYQEIRDILSQKGTNDSKLAGCILVIANKAQQLEKRIIKLEVKK